MYTAFFVVDRQLFGEEVLEKLNDGIGIDENWNLQSYERETVTFGDGYENAEQYVAQTETASHFSLDIW